ncbi:MAG: hypothetical protein AAFO06_05310 [Cyanobacteria bacterium J06597_16]
MTNGNGRGKSFSDANLDSPGEPEVLVESDYILWPGERLSRAGEVTSERIETFFMNLVTKELSREHYCEYRERFKTLKIWLYATHLSSLPQLSQMPAVHPQDLNIEVPLVASELKHIYVLDSGLSGAEYDVWEESCRALFEPLFSRFVAPQHPPDILKQFMVMRFGDRLAKKLFLSLEMRKNMFFDALVIQTDWIGKDAY